MLKSLSISLAALLFAGVSHAANINTALVGMTQSILAETMTAPGNWVVGDTASYKMNMGGFLEGTMKMSVKQIDSSGLVINQEADLSFMGKQSCDITIDLSNGNIKSLVCNGQAQQVPESDMELVDNREETITVPAGTFKSAYLKMLNKKDNTTAEQWVNPTLIPVTGMITAISQSQFGPVTLELTSFKKN